MTRPSDTADPHGPVNVRARGLGKRFGTRNVVDGLDLDVAGGEIVGLLGASGCGKTTTLRMLAGLEVPTAGTIHLGAREVAGPNCFVPPEARGVGMVFQQYALFEHLDVQQNVAFGLRHLDAAARRNRVHSLLDLTALTALASTPIATLSGGEQQRVALARALAPEPSALLLDEPFANLDAHLKEVVMDEVRRIVRAVNLACVLVTHDTDEALSVCDRVYVLQAGRCLQSGTPTALYDAPAHRDIATYVGPGVFLPAARRGDEVDCALGGYRIAAGQGSDASAPRIDSDEAYSVFVRPEQVAPAADGARFEVTARRSQNGRSVMQANAGETRVSYYAAVPSAIGETVTLGPAGPATLFGSTQRIAALAPR